MPEIKNEGQDRRRRLVTHATSPLDALFLVTSTSWHGSGKWFNCDAVIVLLVWFTLYSSHLTAFPEQELEWTKTNKQKPLQTSILWPRHFIFSFNYYQMLKCLGRDNINFITQIMKLTLRRVMEFIQNHRYVSGWEEIWTKLPACRACAHSLQRAALNHKGHLLSAERPMDAETVRLETISRQNAYAVKYLRGLFPSPRKLEIGLNGHEFML